MCVLAMPPAMASVVMFQHMYLLPSNNISLLNRPIEMHLNTYQCYAPSKPARVR